MLIHDVIVKDRALTATPRVVVQHGVNSDAIRLALDDEYGMLDTVSIVFVTRYDQLSVPWKGTPVPIPQTMMDEPGEIGLVVVGRKGDDTRIVTRRMDSPLIVVESGPTSGVSPESPTLDEVEQAVVDANDAVRRVDEALDRLAQTGGGGRGTQISLGSGYPSLGGIEGDSYIDSDSGRLYKYQQTNNQ